MARHALSWVADGMPAAIGLDPHVECHIGRDPKAAVVIDQPTVSRRQAVVRHDGTSFRVENLSATNPTKVDGKAIAGPTAVRDGMLIAAGGALLRFHDLAAGDRVGGPICSHCGRENNRSEADCWFCGTALVNALSTIRARVELVGRVIGGDDNVVGWSAGQALVLGAAGWASVDADPSPDGVALVQKDGGIVLQSGGAGGATATDAGGTDRSGETLRTGDIIHVADNRWAIVVR